MLRHFSKVALVVFVAVGSLAVATAAEPTADSKAKSPPKQLAFDLGKGVKLEMVLIPAGEFMMGSPDSEQYVEIEQPRHRVRITKAFYLGKFLVTQEQWQSVMGNNPSAFSITGHEKDKVAGQVTKRFPAENVSWDDCQRFLAKLNAKIGAKHGKFVLPSEAQWEYACRAGSTTRFYFGDCEKEGIRGYDQEKLGEYAWFDWNSSSRTHAVGEKKPNAWGLYDMAGNVFEWCQDWFQNEYYKQSPVDNPPGPSMGEGHVYRGGCWVLQDEVCRSAQRGPVSRSTCDSTIGFRVALLPADTALSAAEPTPDPTKQITNSIGMKLTLIPSGEFMMGSGESAEETAAFFKKNYGGDDLTPDFFKDEHPQHRVRITRPFYLGAYHVTRAQFCQFVNDSGYRTDAEKGEKPGAPGWDAGKKDFDFNTKYSWRNAGFEQSDEHPVVCVSWNDAMAFCKWLSKREGKTYRLPTEAEWEYACRAGTTTRYSSGDDPETLAKVANVADAIFKAKYPGCLWAIHASDGYFFTAPVGKFKPNSFGLYEMHGNAFQWCADWYAEDYYGKCPADDPTGPTSGTLRVLRGGSWAGRPDGARSAFRRSGDRDFRDFGTGFRVATTQ
jgi:formylglycine-generating enzyme required for sulfatase activity